MIASFHPTGNFEVFSICHLSKYMHKNKNTTDKNSMNSKTAEKNKIQKNSNSKVIINLNNIPNHNDISYFVAGGFYNNDKDPKVKIYQILYDK